MTNQEFSSVSHELFYRDAKTKDIFTHNVAREATLWWSAASTQKASEIKSLFSLTHYKAVCEIESNSREGNIG